MTLEAEIMGETRRFTTRATAIADSFSNQLGVTGAQGAVLLLLMTNADRILHQSDLEELLAVSNPALSKILGKLEAKGFVTRAVDPDDRRSRIIALTDKALDACPGINRQMRKSEDILFAGFTKKEKEILDGFLVRLLENAGAWEQQDAEDRAQDIG